MPEPKANPYIYSALVTNVVDGDTIDVSIDLGFGVSIRERLRLLGINAPETRGPERDEGLRSKRWLVNRVLAKTVVVDTQKGRGKFGRYLATVFLDGQNINGQMIAEGLATEYP